MSDGKVNGKIPNQTCGKSPETDGQATDGNSLREQSNGKSPTDVLASSLVSFMEILHNMAVNGTKVMQDVDSAIYELGLVPLSLVPILESIGKQISESNVAGMVQKLNNNASGNKVVLQVLSIFTQLQLSIVQTASESLSSLLNTEVGGTTLSEYQLSIKPALSRKPCRPLPQVKPLPHKLQSSETPPSSHNQPKTNALETNPTGNQASGVQTNVAGHQASLQTPAPPLASERTSPPSNVQTELVTSSNTEALLVSDAEMKEVIDLLSGVKTQPMSYPAKHLPPTEHKAPSGSHYQPPSRHQALAGSHPPSPSKQPPPTPPKPVIQGYPSYTTQAHNAFTFTTTASPPISTSQPVPANQPLPPAVALPVNVTSKLSSGSATVFHRALGPQISDSVLPMKTNTWPMRPGREGPHPPPLVSADALGSTEVYEGFTSDLEFSQYVNAVTQRSRHRGQLGNPWSVGAAAWSPLGLVYDRQDGRQWTEDSSNASDETSSNGDWNNEVEVGMESKSTNTWPPKHPWGSVEANHPLLPSLPSSTNHHLPPGLGGSHQLIPPPESQLLSGSGLTTGHYDRVSGSTHPGVAGPTHQGMTPTHTQLGVRWTGY